MFWKKHKTTEYQQTGAFKQYQKCQTGHVSLPKDNNICPVCGKVASSIIGRVLVTRLDEGFNDEFPDTIKEVKFEEVDNAPVTITDYYYLGL